MLRILEAGDYFGTTTQRYHGDGIDIVETCFAPNLVIPAHEHINPFFCFVLAGTGTRSWGDRAGAEGPMALTVFPASVPHANCWYGAGGQVMHVEFSSPWLERLGGRTQVLNRPADFSRGAPVALMRRLAVESRLNDSASALAVEGLTLELLAACERADAPRGDSGAPRWLAQVEATLRERYAENLSLDELAAGSHVSADHLVREFRRRFGCTVGDYIRQLRIDFACRKLAEDKASLTQIAEAAGFADQSHFSRVFRKQVGLAPGAYRAQQREDRFRSKT